MMLGDQNAEVELLEYDPNWSIIFLHEQALLQEIIGKYLKGGIEHVGSTAIAGMIAKPVIDIMFGVESLEKSREAINILECSGYCYSPYKESVMHWFCKPSPEYRTHHLYLVPYESPLWLERIKFRDILRDNTDLANEYAELKKALVVKYGYDREKYTVEKWPFIRKVLEL